MIIERTQYFAKPGLAEKVLAIRRKASRVRRDIGLDGGSIFARTAASDAESPDVVWECAFHDEADHAADLKARADSPAFTAVRAEMTACLAKFNRHVFALDDAPLPNGMRPISLRDEPITPLRMTFQSAGRELSGYYLKPPGDGPFPCMICNHGSGIEQGSLDASRPGAAALLLSWGIASFLPHRRGYGDSPGPAWRSEVDAEYGTEAYDRQLLARLDAESDDILAAFDHVLTLPGVDPDHVGLMGSSFGGTTTLFAASKQPRFACAINFAGAAMNWDRTPALRAGMTAAAAKVATPLFLIQAANDYSVRPTRELAASLADGPHPVWSKVYPEFGVNPSEGHLFESRGAQIWRDDVKRFLERYL